MLPEKTAAGMGCSLWEYFLSTLKTRDCPSTRCDGSIGVVTVLPGGTEKERRRNRGGIDGDDRELSQKWRGEMGWKKVVGGTVGGKTHTNTDTDKVEEAKRGRIRGGGYK